MEISWSWSTLASFSGLSRALEGNWYTWYPVWVRLGISADSITCCTDCPGTHWSWREGKAWYMLHGHTCICKGWHDMLYVSLQRVAKGRYMYMYMYMYLWRLASVYIVHDIVAMPMCYMSCCMYACHCIVTSCQTDVTAQPLCQVCIPPLWGQGRHKGNPKG